MLLETINGRVFGFGLTWAEPAGSVNDLIKARLDGDLEAVVVYATTLRKPKNGAAVGVGGLSVPHKSRIYSAADVLAKSGCADGLYAMPLGEGETLWFCGIKGGSVIPGYDLVEPFGDGAAKLTMLSSALGLHVYCDDRIFNEKFAATLEGCSTLSVRNQLAAKNARSLVRRGATGRLGLVITAAIVIGAGVYLAMPSGPAALVAVDSGTDAAQALNAYVQQVRGAVGAYPKEGDWALGAMQRVQRDMPPFLAGWRIDKVRCEPAKCTAQYARVSVSYAVSPFTARFGEAAVGVKPDVSALTVDIPLSTPVQEVDENYLRSIGPASQVLGDWVGSIAQTMAGGVLVAPPTVTNLGEQLNAGAVGMPALALDTATVTGAAFLDAGMLGAIVRGATRSGFRATSVTWSPTVDAPVWSITWSRLHD